jgi:hypothetical protein
MTTTSPTKPAPTTKPLSARQEPDPFPPSAELGQQLQKLGQELAEIDRKKAEELTRLRAIQDRD